MTETKTIETTAAKRRRPQRKFGIFMLRVPPGPARLSVFALVAFVTLVGCAGTGGPTAKRDLSELEIVECIVEGAVRQMGRNFAYQEPPRMARVTEAACAAMGGSFVLFDPAKPESAIEKWLPFAERGDADAQFRLGQIYEGVMGAEPDHARAAYWYAKGAEQGHRRSTYSLSTLYEKGLGVEKDVLRALELYRQASGLEGDRLMLSSTAAREIEAARATLGAEIAGLKTQRDALSAQVEEMRRAQAAASHSAQNLEALQALVDDLSVKLAEREEVLDGIPAFRMLDPNAGRTQLTRFDFPDLPQQMMRTRVVGRFYALVIGNNEYEQLEDLQTPHNDARRIAQLLTEKYGFATRLLLDANEEEIKRAIHRLNDVADEDDNVLIYFAGHGLLRGETSEPDRRKGYWLPINADAEQDVNWVDNWWVTNHLDAGKARRALVIADSCYGGVFSTDLPIGPVTELPPIGERDFERKLDRRGRFVLASGGVAPVLDATSAEAEHSVFANAFIDILENSRGSMSVIEIYGRLFDRMYEALRDTGINQEPELRVIRAAGHESEGDFFFVRN